MAVKNRQTGTPLSTFTDSVVGDIKSLVYPTFESNLVERETRAIKWLKNHPQLIMKPADIVVMSRTYYNAEALRQLDDLETYNKIKTDPTADYKSKLMSLLRRGVEKQCPSQ